MKNLTGSTSSAPPVFSLLKSSYAIARELAEGHPSGMEWRRPARICPTWCRKDHACSANTGYPSGEHRSPTKLWTPEYGQLRATRIRSVTGEDRLELAATVTLHGDPRIALLQGLHLPGVVDMAIKATLTEILYFTELPPAPKRLALKR